MNVIRISSSIANFKEKLLKRYSDYRVWSLWTLFEPTIFFGAYHPLDYIRIFIHRGRRTVFWCGSDILSLRNSWWRFVIPRLNIRHVCENGVEEQQLKKLGITAERHPMIFSNPFELKSEFVPSNKPHVFICAHQNREKEYGIGDVLRIARELPDITFHVYGDISLEFYPLNVVVHGKVEEYLFNAQIATMHAGLRLNEFDGFGEVTAKSILLGQYPITTIHYPHIDMAPDYQTLKEKLLALQTKTVPNPNREYWYNILCNRVEA